MLWAGLSWLRIRYIPGCCAGGNELWDVVKSKKFRDYLRDSLSFKKDSVAWSYLDTCSISRAANLATLFTRALKGSTVSQ